MKLGWKKIKEEKYKAGWRKMVRKTFILPGGKKADYDINDVGDVACVLALTPENKVILERVYRPGPEKILLEMPGGFFNKNENPKSAIERELLEETGFEGNMEFAGSVIDDAYSNRRCHVFIAKDCTKTSEQKLEEDEIFELVFMNLKDFRKHIRTGNLTDTEAGYIALDYLKLL